MADRAGIQFKMLNRGAARGWVPAGAGGRGATARSCGSTWRADGAPCGRPGVGLPCGARPGARRRSRTGAHRGRRRHLTPGTFMNRLMMSATLRTRAGAWAKARRAGLIVGRVGFRLVRLNRHAAPRSPRLDRLRASQRGDAAAALLASPTLEVDQVSAIDPDDRGDPRFGPRESSPLRSTRGNSRIVRVTALPSRTRSCGFPKARTPDFPRAGGRDTHEYYINGRQPPRGSAARVLRTIRAEQAEMIPPGLRGRVRLRPADRSKNRWRRDRWRASTSRVRSTERRATRRRLPRDSSLG